MFSGKVFTETITVTSSDVGTVASTLMGTTGNGLLLEDVIVRTDSTGLAGGTNIILQANNDNGSDIFFQETVANLGANATVDLASASVTSVKQVIETGKNVQVLMTVGAGTGAWVATITFVLRQLDSGAGVTPA